LRCRTPVCCVAAASLLASVPVVHARHAHAPQVDEEPYGLFPPLKGQTGLTPAAEMYNGRMAMMGLIAVITASTASGKDILEVVDIGLGGLLMGSKLG
jgi:hypothetical protein